MKKTNRNLNFAGLDKELNLQNDFQPPLYEAWKKQVISELKGADFNTILKTLTYEGIELQPVYTNDDLNEIPFINEYPGFANYLRGTNPTNVWQIAQTITTGNPEEFNRLLQNSLKNGQTAIFLDEEKNRFCNQQPNAVKDFLQNIDLNKYPINIFCSHSAKDVLPEFEFFLQQQNFLFKKLTGGIYSSPIAFLIKKGYLPDSLEKTFDKLNRTTNFISNKNSKLRSILINGCVYNNAGSNAVQDLAFALASGSEYVYQLVKRGNNVNKIASQISFKFGTGSFYFMEIAKLRAAKSLWSKILEEYGAAEENRKMHIFAQTTSYNQAVRDIHNNILRGTTEAFSAILGGVDVLDVTPFDKPVSETNEFSLHLARNIQNILKEETHLDKVTDVSGGSYYIEKLTNELCIKAWSLFQNVEEQGGIIAALKSNFIQNEIEKTNQKRLSDFSEGKTILVGVNKYISKKEKLKNVEILRNKKLNNLNLKETLKAFTVKPIGEVRAAGQFE